MSKQFVSIYLTTTAVLMVILMVISCGNDIEKPVFMIEEEQLAPSTASLNRGFIPDHILVQYKAGANIQAINAASGEWIGSMWQRRG